MNSPLFAAVSAALFLFVSSLAHAGNPVVSGVSAVQRAGTQLVDITYDVTADYPKVQVTLTISHGGGTIYQVPATAVSGAVGRDVTCGTGKVITWNAGVDWNKQFTPTMIFQVAAIDAIPNFSAIPSGSYQMGNVVTADTDIPDARIRAVTVSTFYMGRNLVTLGDWNTVRTWGLSNHYTDLSVGYGKATNHPVLMITWYDIVKWCNARSEMAGLTPCYTVNGAVYRTNNSNAVVCNWAANGYRLPTEAEWEKSARGGLNGQRFPWGDRISQSLANYISYPTVIPYDDGPADYNATGVLGGLPYTSPGGSFPANGYGLYDMAGNAWQWCWDWYDTYAAGAPTNPRGPSAGVERVFRGGCWISSASFSRTAYRNKASPLYTTTNIGFRMALSAGSADYGTAITSDVVVDTRSSESSLSRLSLTSGTLSPSFVATKFAYTAKVSNATSSIMVTPTVTDSPATVKVNGTTVMSGSDSQPIALAVGPNTITTVVTAQNRVATTTYTVIVTRAPSAVATLSGLALSSGTLSPTFAATKTAYTASVPNATTTITVTPTVTDVPATVKVNGTSVAAGSASGPITLAQGTTTITTVVTAQDGTTTKTYTITVTRMSNVSSLSSLTLSAATLSPAFAATNTAYTASVPNATTTITVKPTLTNATARITVNGASVASGASSASIPLVAGPNTIAVVVTAQDGSISTTYTVTVTRTPSVVATLSGLTVSSGTLSPAFAATKTAYTVSVPNATATITVKPTLTNATARITVNGATVASGSPSASIPLVAGPNVIATVVTAQDGITITTYTVTVTRAPSVVATLSGLALSSGTLTPAFAASTTTYTASVTTSITVTPTATDSSATVKVNGTSVASGSASGPIALAVGTNTITTVVTAQDGIATKTYTLTVTRGLSTVSTLAGLSLSSGTLTPTFAAATTTYTASVPNDTTTITVTPTSTDSSATVQVNGTSVASGSASGLIALAVGTNTITTVVTAQDGITTKTYSVHAIRLDNNYSAWARRVFTDPNSLNDPAISGPMAMPANDGVTNLIKYALALDPMVPASGKLPIVTPQQGHLTLTYRKNKTADDVTYTVQSSDSLSENSWSPATTVLSEYDPTPGGGSYWLVTVQDAALVTEKPARFMRLRVSQ